MPLLITFSRQILIWYHSVLLISVVRSVSLLSLLIVTFYFFFFQFLQFILSFPLHCDPTKWWLECLDVGVPFFFCCFWSSLFHCSISCLLPSVFIGAHPVTASLRCHTECLVLLLLFHSICTFIHTIHSFMRILFSNIARQRHFQRKKKKENVWKKKAIDSLIVAAFCNSNDV